VRKVLPFLAAALLAGAMARGGEESLPKIDVGLDVGSADNKVWTTVYFQPYASIYRHEKGFDWEFKFKGFNTLRKDFSDDGEDAKGKMYGWEARLLAGWGWKLGKTWNLSALGGFSYDFFQQEEFFETTEIKQRFHDSVTAFDVGLRLSGKLSDKLEWVSEVTGGPVIGGSAKIEGAAALPTEVGHGHLIEARTGLNWRLTDYTALHAGAVYEKRHVGLTDGAEDTLSRYALDLGFVFKF
jgi:hypothetical protein